MHANSPTNLPWSSSPPNSFRPPSAAYWRPPTATGLHRPDPPRGDYRPAPPGHAHAPRSGHKSMWRTAQEEARYVIKIEQDRLDRLFASEAEALKRAEEALVQRRARRSREDAEYDERLLADEERRVQHERTRVAKLRADNTEWLSHLIKQETDRIHAAMIEDELEGRLTAEESQWLENNIQKRKAEEERQSLKRAQEEEAERLRKLEEEEEAAKIRAAQAEELAQAARQERFALPPIPDPEELALALYHDPSTTNDDDKAVARLHANPLPRPPKESSRRMSASSESSTRRMSTASTEESTPTVTADAARRAWAKNLTAEWDRRGAREEYHHHHHPEPHARQPQRTPSFSYRYRPASAEAIAAAESMAAARRAEEIRRYNEHVEEVKYRERQAARAAREAREAHAARKAFEEERKRLEEERRKKEDERRKNEEQIVVAAWQRYERKWQDLTNGVFPEGRQVCISCF
ncbi:hypothetical protein B0J17DRAFT_43308 [Rhizoctonia solani]|nr:hypothetical protein B0J17DRAFT_43308 [Rhizoctonia solani]